jgi:hypothetical protein
MLAFACQNAARLVPAKLAKRRGLRLDEAGQWPASLMITSL